MKRNPIRGEAAKAVRVPTALEVRGFGFQSGHAPAVRGGRYLNVSLEPDQLEMALEAAAFDESFTACLRRFVQRSGLSLSAVARGAWLDVAYISRLVNLYSDPRNERVGPGQRPLQPKRDAV